MIDDKIMLIKWRMLNLRHSSPVTLWFGMLLACFAWIMHVSILLTPLWDDNAHLGHGICIKLAPVVSTAKQYEQIQADITHTSHNMPDDSAAYHLHHHTAPNALASTSTARSTANTNEEISSKELHSKHNVENSDPDDIKHLSCDLCISMSAVLVPKMFAHTDSAWFELPAVLVTFLYHSTTHYSNNFLRPLTRAPPQDIFK
ncbi:hypothetical protein QL982_13710 [Psychrobacter sp. 5A.1]|uniref:hypothetical protein n=2 Tax=unclassified Psychrobacter TaxID=196806 RepID=UPI0025B41C7C|nr:hypothetical protein [Psychrobacter sp. 5A.1]MDN3503792.1 hypothetical protein [Psychrobacter sp. 5A.1]